MAERILILGGTREAAALAARLVDEGHHVTTSLAGRTKEPRPVAGAVRVGGFGGAEGLAGYLRERSVDRLIDATHPFATTISRNAKRAAHMTGVPLQSEVRAPWEEVSGDHWIEVGSIAEAVQAIPANARVLLALGAQHIAPFSTRSDVHFLVRMVDAPEAPLPFASHTLALGRPSPDPSVEAAMLRGHGITHILCRNSGGPGAYAKIEAARMLGLPVIMLRRP